MIPLFTQDQFETAAFKDKLPLQCKRCLKEFLLTKQYVNRVINGNKIGGTGEYCSYSCVAGNPMQQIACTTCHKDFTKKASEVKRTSNHFCSISCAATYNNQNKTHGTRRSKLEAWIEDQLLTKYPDLEFHFNRKDAINSELDIFIPTMKLAFELNGVFHYEPIFGAEKMSQIQNNDHRKFAACQEQGISLCIIDTSSQKYFSAKTAKKFLDIIESIILQRVSDLN